MSNAKVIEVLRDHEGVWNHAGNGYTEPRESWVVCAACDLDLWAWQQFYFENEEDPDNVIRQHQADMLRKAGLLKETDNETA